MDTCYLVDYENVKEKGLTGCLNLTAKDSICIFYTENAKNVSWDIFCNHGDAVLTVKKVPTGDQSLDKHLVAWLGYLLGAGKAQEMDFVIVSRDTGFDRIIRFWKAETGITVRRCAQIEDYEKLIKQKASAGVPAQNGEPSSDNLTVKTPEPQEANRVEQPEEELSREPSVEASRKSQQKAEISRTVQPVQESQRMPQTAPAQKEEPLPETIPAEESEKAVLSDGEPQSGEPQEQPQNEPARNAQTPKNNARNNRRQRTQQNKDEARRKTSLNSEVQQVLARAKLPFRNGEINATAKVVSRVYWKEDALSLVHNELRRLYPEEYQDIYALVKPIIERYRREQKEALEEPAAQENPEQEMPADPSADNTQAEDIRETKSPAEAENAADVLETGSIMEVETAEEPEAEKPSKMTEKRTKTKRRKTVKKSETLKESEIMPAPETVEESEAAVEPETTAEPKFMPEPEPEKEAKSALEAEPAPEPEPATEPETAPEAKSATEPEPAAMPAPVKEPEPAAEPESTGQSETAKEEQSEPVKATNTEKIVKILADADYPQEIADFVTQIFTALRNGQIGKMQVYRNILQKYGRTKGIPIYRNIRELL